MIEYRGYFLTHEYVEWSGTDRIRRPDGTWRTSIPTYVGRRWQWTISLRHASGSLDRIDVADSEDAAKQRVDEFLSAEPWPGSNSRAEDSDVSGPVVEVTSPRLAVLAPPRATEPPRDRTKKVRLVAALLILIGVLVVVFLVLPRMLSN